MNKNTIITIGRQFCSGGSEIGQKVAEKLGIPYYDKVILEAAAEKHGFSEEYVKEFEEKHSNSFLYSLASYSYGGSVSDSSQLSPGVKIVHAQFDFIRELAEKGPCVIVGRCSDYILKNTHDTLNIFIYAPMENRIQEAAERYHIPTETALKMVQRTDKLRANYYKFYTDKTWGDINNYDLAINTNHYGVDEAAELIYRAYTLG